MTVLQSASGIRIDCDNCGAHTYSLDATAEQLRSATGFVRPAGQTFDFCARCAGELFGIQPPASEA